MSNPLIDTLVERRANVWEQTKAHIEDIAARDGGEWNGDADETYTRLNADLDNLDARIKELHEREKRQAEAEEAREQFGAAAKAPAQEERTAPTDDDILRAMVRGEVRDDQGKVAYNFAPAERRDLTVGTSTAGGNTVPTSFFARLHEHMIEVSAIRQTNATVITTEAGEALEIPKTTSHSTAAIISEGGTVTESDPAFGKVTLNAYKYGLAIDISSELEQDSAFDLSGYLAMQAGRAIGNKSGTDYVTGDGSGKPYGVVTGSTLGETGANSVAGVFDGDNLIDLFYSVIAPYRRNAYWVMSDAGIALARKLKAGDDNYLWQPGLQAGEPDRLLGKPLVSDTNVADPAAEAKSVLFGDFSAYYIRDVRGVRAERSADFKFGSDLVTWRFLFRTDGDLVDTTGAVKHFIGGTA